MRLSGEADRADEEAVEILPLVLTKTCFIFTLVTPALLEANAVKIPHLGGGTSGLRPLARSDRGAGCKR